MLTKHAYKCPNCGRPTFALYLRPDGLAWGEAVGRCNRENNCGYDYKPEAYRADCQRRGVSLPPIGEKVVMEEKPPTYLREECGRLVVAECKAREGRGVFFDFVASLVGHERALFVMMVYNVTVTRDGRALFWYFDSARRLIDGKVIAYRPDGHRDKSRLPFTLYASRFRDDPRRPSAPEPWRLPADAVRPKLPLFGAHLLAIDVSKDRPVIIVESEKTAVLGYSLEVLRAQQDRRLWVATGGGCNTRAIFDEPLLRGRHLILFPDSDKVGDKWTLFAESARLRGYSVEVVPVASFTPPEWLTEGYDIGDFIVDIASRRPRASFGSKKVLSPLEDMIEQNPTVGKFIDHFKLIEK